ncbi:MAG: hypothetical protein FWC71_11745 [Defluviitaleaceae bacterium]|nr:hypothetical protein [Defluviitaleaceae bacterium]
MLYKIMVALCITFVLIAWIAIKRNQIYPKKILKNELNTNANPPFENKIKKYAIDLSIAFFGVLFALIISNAHVASTNRASANAILNTISDEARLIYFITNDLLHTIEEWRKNEISYDIIISWFSINTIMPVVTLNIALSSELIITNISAEMYFSLIDIYRATTVNLNVIENVLLMENDFFARLNLCKLNILVEELILLNQAMVRIQSLIAYRQ